MLRQYSVFLVNGVLITLLAWLLQYSLFIVIGNESSLGYAVSTAVATAITMTINFFIQQSIIFKKAGQLHRYLIADLFNLLLVTLLSPLFRIVVATLLTYEWGDKTGFLLAAFIASIPVFFLKKHWVFINEARG